MESELLTTAEAATYLGLSTSWLNKSRMTGNGPVYLKLGGLVRYMTKDLDAWMATKRRVAIYDFNNNVPK